MLTKKLSIYLKKFKILVIEMLLNNDFNFFFVQIILNFQKEINIITYIIEI
jgi:hypothetical protein